MSSNIVAWPSSPGLISVELARSLTRAARSFGRISQPTRRPGATDAGTLGGRMRWRGVVPVAAAAALLAGCGSPKSSAPPANTTAPPAANSLRGLVPTPLTRQAVLHAHRHHRAAVQSFDAATRGKLTYLFFGYTHCPDACPATMSYLTYALHQQPAADPASGGGRLRHRRPARDTGPVLRRWLDHYNRSLRRRDRDARGRSATSSTRPASRPRSLRTPARASRLPGRALEHPLRLQPRRPRARRLRAGLQAERLRARPAAAAEVPVTAALELIDAGDEDVLDVDVLVDPEVAALAAVARLLDAAERDVRGARSRPELAPTIPYSSFSATRSRRA